ncbi:MAG: VCBS repeat-containing protein [Myxococcota bacterium]
MPLPSPSVESEVRPLRPRATLLARSVRIAMLCGWVSSSGCEGGAEVTPGSDVAVDAGVLGDGSPIADSMHLGDAQGGPIDASATDGTATYDLALNDMGLDADTRPSDAALADAEVLDLGDADDGDMSDSGAPDTGLPPPAISFIEGSRAALGGPVARHQGVGVADFNLDGHLDIVVATVSNSRVHVFFGDGMGNLGAPATYNVRSRPQALAIGDRNADGAPDIVVVGRDPTDNLAFFTNDGSGRFAVGATRVSGCCRSVALGHLDDDDRADLVLATGNGADEIQIRRTSPFRTDTFSLEDSVEHVRIGDITGDGRNDVMGAGPRDRSRVHVVVNEGEAVGTHIPIAAAYGFPTRTTSTVFDLYDIDDDGVDEILSGRLAHPELRHVILDDFVDGSFATQRLGAIDCTFGNPIYADFSGDGTGDIFCYGTGPGLAVGTEDGYVAADLKSPLGAGSWMDQSVGHGDFNEDGHMDVVVGSGSLIAIWIQVP